MNKSLHRNNNKINSDWILTIQFTNGTFVREGCRDRSDLIAKAKKAKTVKLIAHVWANDFQVK